MSLSGRHYNNEETNKYFKIIHIDGNKLNNKPDNLKQVLTESSNPSNIERKILATNLTTGKTRKFDSKEYTVHLKHCRLIPAQLN